MKDENLSSFIPGWGGRGVLCFSYPHNFYFLHKYAYNEDNIRFHHLMYRKWKCFPFAVQKEVEEERQAETWVLHGT